MSPTPNPTPAEAPPLVLFDGVCNLCNGAVQWLIARDPHQRLRFASLQSTAAAQALHAAGLRTALPDSMVLIEAGRVHLRSEAALRLTRHLRQPWPLLGAFCLIPRPLRDGLYAWIARHRYAWFGQRQNCALPTPALRRRFLDAEELEARELEARAAPHPPSTTDTKTTLDPAAS